MGVLGLIADYLAAGEYTTAGIILVVSGALKIIMRKLTTEPVK